MSFWSQLFYLFWDNSKANNSPNDLIRESPINGNPDHGWTRSSDCPECGSHDWYEGPSGGMSINFMCANDVCGAKYNFTPLGDRFMRELISHGKLHKGAA